MVNSQRLFGYGDGGVAASVEQDWRSYSFPSGKGGRTALTAIDLVASRSSLFRTLARFGCTWTIFWLLAVIVQSLAGGGEPETLKPWLLSLSPK